ncbi:hypothetical protein OSB04_015706 [Centaurea solstitialis]|uniref:Uncharacterized protein n=1 Tax=Centaurea solstitialis TaxID=347529 RepID=A0AA38WKD4_9ASTR|nr:hypothetical protein OSB04_015706 [Centaurea solstitialis]
MAYTGGIQMLFMDNLKKLIDGNHPLINNSSKILSGRPEFQLLYQELHSIIQTLFSIHEDRHHQHHELEKVRDLKKRFKEVVEEAQDTIDLYLSAVSVNFTNSRLSPKSDVFKTYLDLESVMRSIESIKVEFMTIDNHNMKMDSSPRIDDTLKTHSARDAAGTSTCSTKIPLEDFVVGFDRDAKIIRDKLTEDTKQLSFVSIVGMGGLGKTTLAAKLFNDSFLKYHFHIRAWATVSQTYAKRDLLIQILTSIGVQEDLQKDHDSKLHEKLHKKLMGRRYLIVIDDIWSIEAWDNLRLFFPHENTGCRILLTTRINEVALHVKPHGYVHSLPCLTEEESWELLKHKVFHGDECPKWSIKPRMQIVKKCEGLPLSLVVMAGVLAKEAMSQDLWQNIAYSVRSSYGVSDQKECMETLALSYHHLPDHLRECFLYLGGFTNHFRINVREVIWLWVAEGFIEEVGNRSLEDTAKAYLTELINRNLVMIAKRNEIGDVKACKLHDLVRELCVQKAKEEGFFLKIDSPTSSSQLLEGITYKQPRIFTNQNANILKIPHSLTRAIRTLLCFHVYAHWLESIPRSFVLLRVLNIQRLQRRDIPEGLELLVHLRDGLGNFQKYFPNIKKLAVYGATDDECHFESLPYLENLKLTGKGLQGHIAFPATLKKLSLVRCLLPCIQMSLIQLLPKLEVLNLQGDLTRRGRKWDACEQQFRQLKLLTLDTLHIKRWKATSTSFPCLKKLTLRRCIYLEEIPLEIGDIATLEHIEINKCNMSLVESVQRIQHEQHDMGNSELKITVDGMELSFYLPQQGSLQMFMGYLKQIINCNDIPFINNNPMILCERPQFQLLYLELDSIIQTLSNIHRHHHHHELEKVRNLKKRFKEVVEEAQDTIDLFLSAIHLRNIRHSRRSTVSKNSLDLFLSGLHFTNRGLSPRSDVFSTSLELNKVLKSIESIKVALMTINIGGKKMDSSSRINHAKTQSVASSTRKRTGKMKPSLEEIVVGLDHDAEIIRDKLTEDTRQLCVVSIVGMGGLVRFHIRAWATISETYVRRDLLIQILTSTGGVQEDLEKDHDSKLREKLHKKLMGRRYLIVMGDIWSIEAWDDLKLFFPHDNTASRILLTSRLNEVALHVKPHGFVHSLPCLTDEESWELLKNKVFHGDECPERFIKPGRHIARKCHGLPLSVVVMAGVLAQEPTNQDLWEEVACCVSSYIVGDQKGCLKTLALSYYHLPNHLRECFLYLGGFPEDFRINVKRVIRLWMAEGFVEEVGNQSLEDTAKAYLIDLINRNLVIVERRNEIGDVKACKLHDLVRELCGQKAKEEGFFLQIDSTTSSTQLLEAYEQRRIFMNQRVIILNMPHSLTPTVRTLWYFNVNQHMLKSIPHCFVLLRVLDLQDCHMFDFPQAGYFSSLVHLRYLAIWYSGEFPKSICKLWSLQTLILQIWFTGKEVCLPYNITDLVNLRHLWSNKLLHLPYLEKPMNLHSISEVKFEDGVQNFLKCFPNIRKLVLCDCVDFHNYSKYLELLPYLENLKLMGMWKKSIQLLPNLEVLKIEDSLCWTEGQWDACEQQFRQLKLLQLEELDIKQWAASSTSFPCLKQLSVLFCKDLEEIPLEIGEIATLKLIEIYGCSNSVVESAKRIQEEQHDVGNYELKIIVDGEELSLSFSQHGSSESE